MRAQPNPKATLAEFNGPVLETPWLRQWTGGDIKPYTATQ